MAEHTEKAPSLADTAPAILDPDKAKQIRQACSNRDIDILINLAISNGGFLHRDLRLLAWPILLGCHTNNSTIYDHWKELTPHPEEEQVDLDVERSLGHYPNDSIISKDSLKVDLQHLILAVLRNHPQLHYFQGYHDIASVILLTTAQCSHRQPHSLSAHILARLSLLRIRDFMLPTMVPASSFLALLPALLARADPPLARLLPTFYIRDQPPLYAIAATLTLFAHDILDFDTKERLFDYLLATPAAAPLYLFAAILRSRRKEILDLQLEPSLQADADMLNLYLSKLAALAAPPAEVDAIILDAHHLLQAFPPKKLGRTWRHDIARTSVLRTAPSVHAVAQSQDLAQIEYWRRQHAEQAERVDWRAKRRTLWAKRMLQTRQFCNKNRTPLVLGGSVVLVALLAIALASKANADLQAGCSWIVAMVAESVK